jgi:hypothetical protein
MAYEPIDMSDYPYKSGDKLPCGIEVKSVIKGTDEDSFLGYDYREKIYKPGKVGYNLSDKPYIVNRNTSNAALGDRGRLQSNDYVLMGVIGDPQAQGVWAIIPGTQRPQFFRPTQFLELVEKYNKKLEKEKTPVVK